MYTRKITLILLFLFLDLFALNAAAKVTWKMPSLAPKGIGWALYIEKFAMPAITEATDGELDIKWYWGGIMGDSEDYIKKIRIGQVDGLGCAAPGFQFACPEIKVLSIPYLFRSWDEVDYIRKVMFPVFDKYAEKNGFKIIYWADQDFDQVYSITSKVKCVNDFYENKFIMWGNEVDYAILQHLKTIIVPINVPEIPSSLRQKIGDSLFAPAIWVLGTQSYTVLKYFNPDPIRYSPAGVIVSLNAWEKLPEDWRQRIVKTRSQVQEQICTTLRADVKKTLTAFENYGLKREEPSPAELQKLKETTRPVWDEMVNQKVFPKELLDEILSLLENYRKAKK